MSTQPSPLAVLASVVWSLATIDRPQPAGTDTVDHSTLGEALDALEGKGAHVLPSLAEPLDSYLRTASQVEPDQLGVSEALAFWINLYNAGALRLAADAQARGEDSVLRIPGGFSERRLEVGGERLSLDAIEHAKIRRFKDARIHAALVCGSVSCPTLRPEPFDGHRLDTQLDEQMRRFLGSGGAVVTRDEGQARIRLSRVFLWFGGDFTRPRRMPTFLPARRSSILAALEPWVPEEVASHIGDPDLEIGFQPYDWGLRCTVG